MSADSELVKKQYANANNLSTRINLHAKYSTNKLGFGNWIFGQYHFRKNMRILELGCGNGSMWPEYIDGLPNPCELLLSDFSSGMLNAAQERIGSRKGLTYQQIDIMDIPCKDESFDVVIANMMLYHVPDIDAALAEVRRVLKKDGVFYCATYGENGLMRWLNEAFCEHALDIKMNTEFTLQNGEAMLKKHFSAVRQLTYPDAFEITDTWDLVDYVCSMTAMAKLEHLDREMIFRILDNYMVNGVIHIPKEYGMFVSR